MSTTTLAGPVARPPKPLSPWEFWGRVLVVPYLFFFVVFVLYPVGYGLWLARHPDSYVKLFEDPIFFRTAINTVVFLVVGINLKMAVAMVLSGFFIQSRWWIKALSLLFILPWAVPSIPTILSMIWTLGDFNSVYLLTGGGPADLTHVLATLGIRYLRLDQVDLAMASIVVALPLVLPLVYFMMKRLSK